MTYNVFGGSLNLTQPKLNVISWQSDKNGFHLLNKSRSGSSEELHRMVTVGFQLNPR